MQLDKKTVRTVLQILCGTILFAWCLVNHEAFFAFLRFCLSVLTPFFIGLAVAFILNVPMRAIENRLFSKDRWKKRKGTGRVCSLCLTLLAFFLIVAAVICVVVPQLKDTFGVISVGMPSLLARIEIWGKEISGIFPSLADDIYQLTTNITYDKVLSTLTGFFSSGAVGNLLGSTVNIATSVVGGVVDFFIGIVFAFYILAQKEKLGVSVRKVLYAWCGVKAADETLYVAGMANRVFSHFISGQCLEAVILGSLFFISMSLFGFPYAMLVSVVITVTALIPIFGAFIGCGVGVFLMLVQNPMQAVWFVVLFLTLQQIEGNFIYPRVVGSSIGLPAMWVLLAVTLGGSLAGVIGMLLMVPTASVCYALFRENTNRRLTSQAIPPEKYQKPPSAR